MSIEERFENMERELKRMKRRNRWLLGAILLVAGGLIVPGVFETTAVRARAQVAGKAKAIETLGKENREDHKEIFKLLRGQE